MLLLLLASAACGGTGASESAPQGDPPTSEADECGRVEAAARSSLVFFEVMGEMGEDCAQGDPLACNPANYVIAPLAGILYAPMGFLIGLTSEDVERYYCARAKAASGPKGSGAPKAPSPIEKTAEFELWRKAAGGNAQAQYDVASQLDAQSDPASREASRYWLCLAAQQGHAAAQGRMGDHRRESAQPPQPWPKPKDALQPGRGTSRLVVRSHS
jgi:TPR repeat protein